MNEWLWFSFLILDFGFLLLSLFLFGRGALIGIVMMDIILCNIQVMKLVNLFGVATSLGSIAYGTIYLATDLMGEVYGKKAAKKVVWMGFACLIFVTIALQLSLIYHPHPHDFAHGAMQTLFAFTPRIVIASLVAFLISQFHDVWAFHYWKKKTKGKHLWLRNNASTLVSQLIDSLIFVMIGFYGIYSQEILYELIFSTFLIKAIVAILDTPIVYLGRAILLREKMTKNQNLV